MTQPIIAPYTSFPDALTLLANYLHLNAADLNAYAEEDKYGGRDTSDFSAMCLHRDEGRALYALVRALRPQTVLEIGVADGGSATHLLSALKANGSGQLISYDLQEGVGASVPADLRDAWTLRITDVQGADLPQADFIFEDAAHTLDFSLTLYARLKALAPRALVVHDYMTGEVYPNFYVKEAFDTVFPGGIGLKIKDAFTGFGVWGNPDWKAPKTKDQAIADRDRAGYEAAKRRPAKRAVKR